MQNIENENDAVEYKPQYAIGRQNGEPEHDEGR